MDKKATIDITMEKIISLISFAIVASLIIWFITGNFNLFASEVRDDATCEASIRLAESLKKLPTPGGTGEQITPLKCERGELLFKKKDIVENGKINQEKANQMIAESMLKCWKKVGEGKIDPFSQWDNKGESYCLICDTVRYDDDLEEWMKEKVKDNPENIENYIISSPNYYLSTEKIPSGKDKGTTYWQYLYNEKQPTFTQDDINQLRKLPIQPGTVVLVNMYKTDSKTNLWQIVGVTGVVVAGVLMALPTGGSSLALVIALGAFSAFTISSTMDSFSDCPTCNGVGGIMLLPSTQSFNYEILRNVGEKEIKAPLCTILVN